MITLERGQMRLTRMLPGLERFSYEERLVRVRLFFLEQRRLSGDLIEVYKIMRDICRASRKKHFSAS